MNKRQRSKRKIQRGITRRSTPGGGYGPVLNHWVERMCLPDLLRELETTGNIKLPIKPQLDMLDILHAMDMRR